MKLNAFIVVEVMTKLPATQAHSLVKQELSGARIKQTQTLVENFLARAYQTQARKLNIV